MVQVILKAAFNAGWGGSAQYFSLAGDGQIPFGTTFGISYTKIVMPIDGSFNNLTVYSADAHPNYTVALMVNGVATSLLVGLPAGDLTASNLSSVIPVSEGDDVAIRVVVSPAGVGSGYDISVGLEFTGAQQIYGLQPFSGSVSSTNPATMGRRGGILLNGDFEVAPFPISVTLSNTYSIASVAGDITKLVMKAYGGAPGAGVWTGYLIKNGVLQDGTGGTVDTSVIMTGTDLYVSTTFTLPITLGDQMEFIVVRTALNAPNMPAQISAAIAFTPDSTDSFMNTGGSGDTVSSSVPTYLWNRSEQLSLIETAANVPITGSGINVTGLYVEIRTPSGPGRGFTYTLRKNGANTAATFTIMHPAVNGQILGLDIDYELGDVMTLQITPVNTPISSDHYWGLISLVEPSEDGGIYQLVPGKTDDTIYSGDDTVDVKIPDPYFKTGLLGE